MESSNSSIRILSSECIIIIGTLLFICNDGGKIDVAVAYWMLAINISTILKVRHSPYLSFVFLCITYCNYSICVANYTSRINTYFAGYAGTTIGSLGLNILMLFSTLLYIVSPYTSVRNNEDEKPPKRTLVFNNRYNTLIVLGANIILAFIWVYGFTRPDVVGQRGSPSALYEYSIVFIIVALYYCGSNRVLTSLTTAMGMIFAIQNFAFGGRITGVQILVLLVLAIYVDKLKPRVVIPVGVAFFIIMSAIGQMRGQILTIGFNAKGVIEQLAKGKFALDTAYSSYYTSMTFLDVMGNTNTSKRLYLFSRWALSMILGGSLSDSNLAVYTRQTHMHYFGGVLPYFGWFYFGILGVVLLALYLRVHFRILNNVNTESSGLVRCVSLYTTCTCLRWYLYSPSQLFRGVALLCVLYGICYYIDKITAK